MIRPCRPVAGPLVIPAIDVLGGRCVRLRQGDPAQVTAYDPDPVGVAGRFAAGGATRLHLVDLDAALGRPGTGLEVLRRTARDTGLPIQYGGGLRSADSLKAALDAGAAWVITGTAALEQRGFLAAAVAACAGRLIVALDLRAGRPMVRGWRSGAALDLAGAVDLLVEHGVRAALVTDTEADGTLGGVDESSFGAVLDRPFGVICAGGVSTLEDIRGLAALAPRGVAGIVAGSALLSGRFTILEAQAAADGAAAGLRPGREAAL